MIDSDSTKTDLRRVVVASRTTIDDARVSRIATAPSHVLSVDGGTVSVSRYRTRPVDSQPGADLHHGCVRLGAAFIPDQPLYRQVPRNCVQNVDDATSAYVSDAAAATTPWNEQVQSTCTHPLVSCRYDVDETNGTAPTTPTSFWLDDSPAYPPNYEFRLPTAPFDDGRRSCRSTTQRWSDSAMMADDWLNTSSNCAGLGSVDRLFSVLSPPINRF